MKYTDARKNNRLEAFDDMLKALEGLVDSQQQLIGLAERAYQPESHEGPCGPHGTGCDGICMDNASVSRVINESEKTMDAVRAAIAKARGES